MKYRLKKDFQEFCEKNGYLNYAKGTILEDTFEQLPAWVQPFFEPVNERIELVRSARNDLVYKPDSPFTEYEIKSMEAALNNELYSEEEIREAWDISAHDYNCGYVIHSKECFFENLKSKK